MILYGSVSSNEKSPRCSPSFSPPAMAKLSKRPFFSHSRKAEGMDTVRFVSMRGDQNASWIRTWVNGTSMICAVFCPWMAMEKAAVQKVHAVRFKNKILFLMG